MNSVNKNPQLIVPHTKNRSNKNEELCYDIEKRKKIHIFQILLVNKYCNNKIIGCYKVVTTIKNLRLFFSKLIYQLKDIWGKNSCILHFYNIFYNWPNMYKNTDEYARNWIKWGINMERMAKASLAYQGN